MPMKKTSRSPRYVWKREIWKPYKVLVQRDRHGRFRHWARIRPKPRLKPRPKPEAPRPEAPRGPPRGKSLAIYGKAEVRKGLRAKMIQSKRWELVKGSLSGQEWMHAVGIARRHPPQRHLRRIYAEDIEDEEYEGEWVDTPEIESA